MRSILIKSWIIIIAILSVVTSTRLFIQTGSLWLNTNSEDQVTLYEKRFAGIRKFLPDRGVIGYVTEFSPNDVMADGNLQAEYYLTQYTMAPVVVDNNPRRNIVIGNFHSNNIPDMSRYGRLSVIKDLGNGIIVFRNEDIST